MFYQFRQNNSGGSFIGPAINVIVEADRPEEANDIAEANGVYFDGVRGGRDCDCCGDRWYPQWEQDSGKPVPSHYGKPIDLDKPWDPSGPLAMNWGRRHQIPNFIVVYKDGSQKIVK